MNSEKVKEIKDSIQRKINRAEKGNDDLVNCVSVDMLKMYLTLINELESENEKWQKDCADIANDYQEMGKFYYEETEKNQKLKDRIAELEKENDKLKQHKRELQGGQQDLTKRIAELEEGIAKSMLGCEFLPECTKEVAEKIWNMSKITVDATKHIIQGREYLHLDALKEIIKSLGV